MKRYLSTMLQLRLIAGKLLLFLDYWLNFFQNYWLITIANWPKTSCPGLTSLSINNPLKFSK